MWHWLWSILFYMKYPSRVFQKFIRAYPELHCVASNIKKTLIRKTYLSLLVFLPFLSFPNNFLLTHSMPYVTEEQNLVMSSFRLRKNLSIYDDLNLKHFDKKHLFKVKGFLLHFLNLCFWTMSVKFQDVLKP